MKAIHRFFMSGYRNQPEFEQRKASYLLYILYALTILVGVIATGQFVLCLGWLYATADILGMLGLCTALFLFKYRRTEMAGHLTIVSSLTLIFCENIFHDIYSNDPAMRFRIYLVGASLLGLFFLVVAFFRSGRVILFYTVVFEIILAAHSFVIFVNLTDDKESRAFALEHYITVALGIVLVAVICNWLLAYIKVLFDQNTEYATRIQQQNDQLEKMVAERTSALQSSNENLREFAHIVSHDLKEPLRTISGFVTLIKKKLQRGGYHEDEIQEYISYVTRGTLQMESLISDILAYSKLNVFEKRHENVDMDAVLSAVRSSLAKSIYESEAELLVLNLETVSGEKPLLIQLFQNLISNAIKYRSDHRGLRIVIGCTQNGDTLTYFVQDNGIGISEKYYDTIFQAFKRLHSRAKYEGTGVGLAICKKIIDIHEGEIWVDSAEGQGSTFYFTLKKGYAEDPAMYPVVQAL